MKTFKSAEELCMTPVNELICETAIMFKGSIYQFKSKSENVIRGFPAETLDCICLRCDEISHEIGILYNPLEVRYIETRYCRP